MKMDTHDHSSLTVFVGQTSRQISDEKDAVDENRKSFLKVIVTAFIEKDETIFYGEHFFLN